MIAIIGSLLEIVGDIVESTADLDEDGMNKTDESLCVHFLLFTLKIYHFLK